MRDEYIYKSKTMTDNTITSLNSNNADTSPEKDFEAMQKKLETFEKFVARRFDEISMEINATSQLLDMAEDGAEKRFANMLSALQTITQFSGGQTAANSGAELETAVVESEEAANKILDATENISVILKEKWGETDDMEMISFIEQIDTQVQDIFLACSFQDLVGQRIRKATEALRSVEDELSQTMGQLGLNVKPKENTQSPAPDAMSARSSQDDIDALFD